MTLSSAIIYRNTKYDDNNANRESRTTLTKSQLGAQGGDSHSISRNVRICVLEKEKPQIISSMEFQLIVTEYRDLGVIVDSSLSFDKHITATANRGHRMVGLFRHTFRSLSQRNFKILVKTFIRPLVEYCSSIWSPHLQKHIDAIEKVQLASLHLCKGIHNQNLDYNAKLKILYLPTLVERRRRGDIIESFKVIRGFYNLDCESLYSFVGHKHATRQNSPWTLERFTTDDVTWLCRRVIPDWNRLPSSVISAQTVNAFKNLIDVIFHFN